VKYDINRCGNICNKNLSEGCRIRLPGLNVVVVVVVVDVKVVVIVVVAVVVVVEVVEVVVKAVEVVVEVDTIADVDEVEEVEDCVVNPKDTVGRVVVDEAMTDVAIFAKDVVSGGELFVTTVADCRVVTVEDVFGVLNLKPACL
jgi:hypothetical protein